MKFGLELELAAHIAHGVHYDHGTFYERVLYLLKQAGITKWKMDEDASCGNEFVSPPLEVATGWDEVERVVGHIKHAQRDFGFQRLTGNDTGVHYHFDVTDLIARGNRTVRELRNMLIISALLEPLWYAMNPGSRFDTSFAAPLNFNMFQMIRARDMTDLRDIWFRPYMGVRGHQDSYRTNNNQYLPDFVNDAERKPDKYDWTRYHGMNFVSVFKHGTVEFRYPHGSFDLLTLRFWFQMFRDVVMAARDLDTKDIVKVAPMSIDTIKMSSVYNIHSTIYNDLKLAISFLFKILPQDVRLLRFILSRLIKFNQNAIPKNVIKKILEYSGDFPGLMKLIEGAPIKSLNIKRSAYKMQFTEPQMTAQQGNPSNEFIVANELFGDEDSLDEDTYEAENGHN